jgi:hypothetical protein
MCKRKGRLSHYTQFIYIKRLLKCYDPKDVDKNFAISGSKTMTQLICLIKDKSLHVANNVKSFETVDSNGSRVHRDARLF